jgi:hypothetical protein
MKRIARAFNKGTWVVLCTWSLNEQFGFKSKVLHGYLTDLGSGVESHPGI